MNRIKLIRREVDDEFESCVDDDAKQNADDFGIMIKTSRVYSKHQHRENVFTDNPRFLLSIYCDHFVCGRVTQGITCR